MKKGEESPEGCIELCLYWFKGNLDRICVPYGIIEYQRRKMNNNNILYGLIAMLLCGFWLPS